MVAAMPSDETARASRETSCRRCRRGISSPTSQHRLDRLGELVRAERQPAHAVVADRVDEELGAHELQQLARGSSRGRAPCRSARSTSPMLRGNGFRCAGARARRSCRPCARGARRPLIGPYVPPQPSTSSDAPSGIVDLELGDVGGDPGDLLRAQAHHEVVVVGVVRDVAGDVRLLEPADPVLEPGRARDRPRPRERLRVAQVRHERRRRRSAGRELDRDVRQRRRRPGAATARSRSRGTRRRAGRPACGT